MKELNKQLQARFIEMCNTGKLFRSSVSGQQVWEVYLNGFTKEDNPIFRDPNSSTHNCNNCHNFVRRYGNIVAVDTAGNVMTIWDNVYVKEFNNSAENISELLQTAKIQDVFFETFNELKSLPYEKCSKTNTMFQLGTNVNYKQYTAEEVAKYGVVNTKEVYTFNHLHLFLPKQFVDTTSKSIEAIMAEYRDAKNVFQRAMVEIPLDTLNLVKDLIIQGSLLDGQTHLYKIEQFIPLKQQYDAASNKDNWCWINSYKLPFAKFKNELIGVLCTELAEGKELNDACQAWNKRVDPANYMKAVAPITKRQIEEAKKFVEENDYVESFNRRFATIDDIKASEILHVNIGNGQIPSVSLFDSVKSTSTRHKRSEFDKVEEVSIDKFMSDILPTCNSVEAYLENRLEGNMVSLTTANIKESKPIFKWTNNYSWTFNGNLAGKSMIKDAIQSRGGKTEGVVNIRLAFPNTTSDYDLHVIEPNGNHIYYGNKRQVRRSSGMLDLDAQGSDGDFSPEKRVENVIFTDEQQMPNGKYQVIVNNYDERDRNFGFVVEIEINGEMTTFNHNAFIPNKASVNVCNIDKSVKGFEIQPILPVSQSNTISREIYGIQTNEFHKVNLVCLSPNHWAENNVGNKHYLFMLEGAKCSTSIRSFHAENLIPELAQHRKVLEVLGNTTMINPTDKQLSGLGFNSTVRDEVVLRLSGSHRRVIKVKF